MGANEFRFFLSCDINSPATFRVEKLDGNLPYIYFTLCIKFGLTNLIWIDAGED
ncbi:unnamed protein product [Arabidopsis halleri]